jgi:hypothetical protein
MKKSRHRTPGHKVNKRQREDALNTLHRIATDPTAPAHAAGKAAAALLAADKSDRDVEPEMADAESPKYVVLPDNGRRATLKGVVQPPVYGLNGDDTQRVVIVPRGYKGDPFLPSAAFQAFVDAEETERAAKLAQARARMAAMGIEAQPVEPDGFGGHRRLTAPALAVKPNPFGMSDAEYAEIKEFCDARGMPPAPGEAA